MDTLVDPVETVSSSHLRAALPVGGPRPSFKSLDPDAQVQWFSRDEEVSASIDIDVSWDEEVDAEPTLVLRRRALG